MAHDGENKIVFDFKALEEYAEKLDKIGGDIREATENALEECHGYITSKDRKRYTQTPADRRNRSVT